MNYLFKKLIPKAKQYLDDNKRLKKLLSKATDKSVKLKDKENRDSFKDDLFSSVSLVKDWSSKEYTDIPIKSLTSIIAAIIYFVIPTDLIPDFILGTGFLDDAAVLSYLFATIKTDIDKYKLFKENKSNRLSIKDKAINAYESSLLNDKNRFLFFNNIYFFSKNEYSRDGLIEFLTRNEKEYKNKLDNQDWYILSTDNAKKTKTTELSNYLFYSLTAYALAYCKIDEEKYFEDAKDLIRISHLNKELEECCIVYLNILKKILNNESNPRNIFFNIDFEKHPIVNRQAFDLVMGRYTYKEAVELNLSSNNFEDILESILYLINKSDSFEKSVALAEEFNYNKENYAFGLFVSSLFFKNKISDENIINSKMQNIL